MLDDASIDGLEEAFRLLPISNTGTGLLVTSYLIKSKDFHSRLAAKAAGAPTCVEDCECAVLSEAKALQLFQLRGFNVDSEEWFSGVSHELKVGTCIFGYAVVLYFSHISCSGHVLSSGCCTSVCRVVPPLLSQEICPIFRCETSFFYLDRWQYIHVLG